MFGNAYALELWAPKNLFSDTSPPYGPACTSNDDCSGDYTKCHTRWNDCVECNVDADCSDNKKCDTLRGICRTDTLNQACTHDGECLNDQLCDSDTAALPAPFECGGTGSNCKSSSSDDFTGVNNDWWVHGFCLYSLNYAYPTGCPSHGSSGADKLTCGLKTDTSNCHEWSFTSSSWEQVKWGTLYSSKTYDCTDCSWATGGSSEDTNKLTSYTLKTTASVAQTNRECFDPSGSGTACQSPPVGNLCDVPGGFFGLVNYIENSGRWSGRIAGTSSGDINGDTDTLSLDQRVEWLRHFCRDEPGCKGFTVPGDFRSSGASNSVNAEWVIFWDEFECDLGRQEDWVASPGNNIVYYTENSRVRQRGQQNWGYHRTWVAQVTGGTCKVPPPPPPFKPADRATLKTAVDACLAESATGDCTTFEATFWQNKDPYGSISNWDTSLVTSMNNLFDGATSFNKALNWNVSSVTDFTKMFFNAQAFNQNISAWDFGSATIVTGMFSATRVFENGGAPFSFDFTGVQANSLFSSTMKVPNLAGLKLSGSVEDMFSWSSADFSSTSIGDMDTSAVTSMARMFNSATNFNEDINGWTTSNVVDMKDMFRQATSFNKDISSWDVSKVTDMTNMFRSSSFNQDISEWKPEMVYDVTYMFRDTPMTYDLTCWGLRTTGEQTSLGSPDANGIVSGRVLQAPSSKHDASQDYISCGGKAFDGNFVYVWVVSLCKG